VRRRALNKADEDRAYRALRAALLPGACEVCARLEAFGVPTPHGSSPHRGDELHHRRKRSASGALAERANVLVSCHEGNMLVEAYPVEAHRADLVVREGDPEWSALSSRTWRLAHS
jgi:hypothetical protein